MSLKLRDKTYEFLSAQPNQRFTARQIADWMFETYPAECEEKQQNSTATANPLDSDKLLIQQIVAEIGASRAPIQKKYPNIKTTAEKPRKYYYSEISDEEEVAESTSSPDKKISEADLYPRLADYLNTEHNLFSKRIDEKTSRGTYGKGGNEWLHPDLVATQLLDTYWEDEIKQLHKAYGNKNNKIWAFEVKLIINSTNVRKAFFQAVSNSSWANLGYLVTGEINEDAIKELEILCNLHGIGVINLGNDDTTESNIIIPAREREIDWNTANRLAKENKDFRNFIKTIEELLRTEEKYYETLLKNAKFYLPIQSKDD